MKGLLPALLVLAFATPALAQVAGEREPAVPGERFVLRDLPPRTGAPAIGHHRCPHHAVRRGRPDTAVSDTSPTPAPLAPSTAPVGTFSTLQGTFSDPPPDTNGAVGPAHVCTPLNTAFAIQGRDGRVITDQPLDVFWNVYGPFDPRVVYDATADRWIVTSGAGAHLTDGSSELLIAASQTGDPTGAWTRFQIKADVPNGAWCDFPQVGFDGTRVVVTMDLFDASDNFVRTDILVFDKAKLYQGVDSHVRFSTSTGPISPSLSFDTTTTYYLIQEWGSPQLRMSTIVGPPGQEVLTFGTAFPTGPSGWAEGSVAFGGQQLGSTTPIDLSETYTRNLVLRNGSLWTTQTVFLPASSPTHAAVQWWELGTDGSVRQFGRVEDPSFSFAFPSIAVNAHGDALVGYSSFSSTIDPTASYSVRVATDPVSTLRDRYDYRPGTSFFEDGGAKARWGDYSATVVDPANDTDFWTVQEFTVAKDAWAVGWAHVAPSGSTAPEITGPASLASGTVGTAYPSVTFTAAGTQPITWSVTSGSPPPGLSLSSSGVYSGTPTTAGNYSFTVTATNSAGSASKAYAQTITGALASIVVTPSPASVATGGTVQFSAQGQDANGNAVPITPTWSATGGTISSSGLYTAGQTTGTFDVSASSGGVTGHASVTINSPAAVIIDDSDSGFSILSGSWSVHYNPYRYGPIDHTVNAPSSGVCQWRPSSLPSGTYDVYAWWPSRTSPATATYTIVTASGNVSVTVDQVPSSAWGVWNKLGTFSLASATAAVQVSAAGGQNVAADAVRFVSSTTYTPVLTTVAVSPSSASLAAGGTQQFTATGKDQNGNAMSGVSFTWTATGGTISSSGLYTAGAIASTFSVTATSGSVSGSATVTITASSPVLTSITVSPSSASLAPGGTQQFTATANDQNGNTMTGVSFTWTATGGTITSSGLYTAGQTAGTFSVTATSGSVSGSATVTIAAATSEVIVDDGTAGYTVDSGLWDVHYTPYRYGPTNRRIRAGTTGVCRFTPALSSAGTYDVYAWWPSSSDTTVTAVPYTVHGNGVTQSVAMNQTTNWGTWVKVGRFSLAPGSSVTVTASSGVNAAADAVRFVYVGP